MLSEFRLSTIDIPTTFKKGQLYITSYINTLISLLKLYTYLHYFDIFRKLLKLIVDQLHAGSKIIGPSNFIVE